MTTHPAEQVRELVARAERAESELAKLRARIEAAPSAELQGWPVVDGKRLWAPAIFLPIDGTGMPIGGPFPRRVRLLVEDEG